MANEVVNPYQTYRDAIGRPLAGGKLRILEPGTSALGTAFSDSALTIPQVVDGYRLDAYGRVTGDLRWPGIRDVELYDANDGFIRKYSDNVTLIDSSSFAINSPDVPAMIANLTLVLGDVVETQSYNPSQGQGGARYLIVANGTGVEDSYIYHDLDNGLQAELIDQEANNNYYVAGAIGDGVADDTAPVQRLFDLGGDIECANGVFAAASLTLGVAARIAGNGTLLRFPFANSDLITITAVDLFATFDGVILDGNLSNQSAEQTIAIIRGAVTASAGNAISFVHFNNVQFQNGSQYDVIGVGDDTGFPVLYSFAQCNFLGGEEGSGTFPAASVAMQDGVNCAIEDCYWNLQVAATTGRSAVVGESSAGTELANPGTLSVAASTLIGMGMELGDIADSRGAIDARQVTNLILQANRILSPQCGGIVFDAGVTTVTIAQNLIDGMVESALSFGSIAAVATINAAGGMNWQIDGNTITGGDSEAIQLDGSSVGVSADRIQVRGNLIDGPAGAAVLMHNIQTVAIQGNYINMETAVGISAIEVNVDGVLNQISVQGNEIANVDGAAILNAVSSPTSIWTVEGNTIEAAVDGIDLVDVQDAYITNNVLVEVSGVLINVGTMDNCRVDGNSNQGTAPATYMQNAGGITALAVGENFWLELDATITQIAVTGANITAGPVEAHFHIFVPTGATSIDTLSDPGLDGWLVVLQGDGVAAVTLNDALGNMNLGAATRVLTDATDTITLMWNQTNSEWNELSYSNN